MIRWINEAGYTPKSFWKSIMTILYSYMGIIEQIKNIFWIRLSSPTSIAVWPTFIINLLTQYAHFWYHCQHLQWEWTYFIYFLFVQKSQVTDIVWKPTNINKYREMLNIVSSLSHCLNYATSKTFCFYNIWVVFVLKEYALNHHLKVIYMKHRLHSNNILI